MHRVPLKKIDRSAKSDAIRLFSRVFWSDHNVIIPVDNLFSTGLPYRKCKKVKIIKYRLATIITIGPTVILYRKGTPVTKNSNSIGIILGMGDPYLSILLLGSAKIVQKLAKTKIHLILNFKTGQIHTFQKHTQNRPSTLRGRDKPLFVFLVKVVIFDLFRNNSSGVILL